MIPDFCVYDLILGDLLKYEKLKKLLSFSLQEKEIIKKLEIPADAFLPLLLSIKYGGDWSLKKNSTGVMAIKEKSTHYDEEKKIGYTLENIFLFLEPCILSQDGSVYRLEKCSTKNERELIKRPYKITLEAKYILKAVLNPMSKKITLRKMESPLTFTGSSAYGISHEMEHLLGEEGHGKPFWEFEYELDD